MLAFPLTCAPSLLYWSSSSDVPPSIQPNSNAAAPAAARSHQPLSLSLSHARLRHAACKPHCVLSCADWSPPFHVHAQRGCQDKQPCTPPCGQRVRHSTAVLLAQFLNTSLSLPLSLSSSSCLPRSCPATQILTISLSLILVFRSDHLPPPTTPQHPNTHHVRPALHRCCVR